MKTFNVLKIVLFISGLIAIAIGGAILIIPTAFYATYSIELGGNVGTRAVSCFGNSHWDSVCVFTRRISNEAKGERVMSLSIEILLLWIAALSSGLMAGVYFTFSAFVMKAFASIESSKGIAAMNAINEVILRSLFMPVFFGSSIVSVLLIIFAFTQWSNEGSALMLISGLVYFVGMFLCTALFNVPLNNSLADLNENSSNAQQGLEDLSLGEDLTVSQNLGEGAEDCHLDANALAQVAKSLTNQLSEPDLNIDLFIINRFGQSESEGHGMFDVFSEAVMKGIPVLTCC
ncbi:Molybdenum import ATP-binding protein ModC 2 [Nymphon striatum]|nr:Molybdenum import ATP-binding protein ModC 2 [Nymphon striatum]